MTSPKDRDLENAAEDWHETEKASAYRCCESCGRAFVNSGEYPKRGFIAGAAYQAAKDEARVRELVEVLKYYAHPDHYEETLRMSGIQPPGILKERGHKAQEALKKYEEGKENNHAET